MQVVSTKTIDMSVHGITTDCKVHQLHVKVSNIEECAQEMMEMLLNTSWVSKLGIIPRSSYQVRAEPTITDMVDNVLNKNHDEVSDEFGEYMISHTAGLALEEAHTHTRLPLAELWKEKISGNPGFDFHTLTLDKIIAFGEAKYSAKATPYTKALEQIVKFINAKKDISELVDLTHFTSESSVINAHEGSKGFVAAFSLNAKKPDLIFTNALKSDEAGKLLCHKELYLVGIEIESI